MTMSIPAWVLLGFAAWTLLLLVLSVGVYRWSRLLTGQAQPKDFRADDVRGSDFYRRAMRAHANCVENLPVYGAIVLVAALARVQDARLDVLALVILGARILHSIVHVAFVQTNVIASIRFAFFFTQLVCMVWMGAIVVWQAA